MKFILTVCIIFYSLNLYAFFDYDRAVHAGQRNDWAQSTHLLKQALVEQADRPDLLYDLGVSSFKNKEFEQALSYFNQASQKSADIQLQEQAYFNAGNTHVQLKQLQEAITAYDNVLRINPANKQAAHNKEVVKKMLEQQKQSEKENQDQNKDDKEDNKQDKNQPDQQKNEDDNKQQTNNNDAQNKQNNDNQNQKEQHPDNASDMTQKPEQSQQKNNQKEQANDTSAAKQEAQKDQSASATQQQAQSSADNKQENDQLAQKVSPQLMRILEQQEKKDAQLNKQVMKAMAGQGGDQDGRNNW